MTTATAPLVHGPVFLVEQVRRCVAALRAEAPAAGAGGWTVEDRERVIAELDAVVQETTVYRGQVLLAHREDGRWGSVSDRDFADYRSRTTGSGRGAAMGDLQLAEGLEQMPAVADAVERGELTLEHAKTLTRLQRGASKEVRDALADGGLDGLLEVATQRKLTAPDLGKRAKAWAAGVDAAAAQAEYDAVRRRRSFTMRKHAGGVAGEFFLDPIAGDQLRIALEAIAGRPAADEDRTREQRMADALITMASRVVELGTDRAGAQVRPQLVVLVAEQTWVGIAARRRRYASCPDGTVLPWPDVPAGELEDGTVIPVGELERLMCDCELTRTVLTAAGVPLDVGRTERTYTKKLRRAVLTRDRHCQWPQCRMRASWCEVHHITWWSHGGTTCLEEAVTLCSWHHHRVHDQHVRITPVPGGFEFHYRNGDHIGTTHRDTLGPLTPDPGAARDALSALEVAVDTGAARGADGHDRGSGGHGGALPAVARPPGGPPDVKVRPPLPPPKLTGPAVAGSAPLPSYPSTYASAPATLWDADPPF